MIIVIDLSTGSVSLRQPGTFDRFSVEVAGEGSEERLASVVDQSGLGRVRPDGDHLVVDPLAVRRLAGGAATVDWERGFEGMCAYAAGKGWIETDGGIQAHIEWRGPS